MGASNKGGTKVLRFLLIFTYKKKDSGSREILINSFSSSSLEILLFILSSAEYLLHRLKPEDILAICGIIIVFALLDFTSTMSFLRIAAIVGIVAFASKAAAHGTVNGIVADGV
jgi:hypothetical protein